MQNNASRFPQKKLSVLEYLIFRGSVVLISFTLPYLIFWQLVLNYLVENSLHSAKLTPVLPVVVETAYRRQPDGFLSAPAS